MPITYPRNTKALYVLFDAVKSTVLRENIPYARADGKKITGLEPNLVYLEIIQEDAPKYDSIKEKLESTVVVDVENGNYTRKWKIVSLPQKQVNAGYDALVDAEEDRRINEIIPQNLKLKSLMRAVFFADKKANAGKLTSGEASERVKMLNDFNQIDAINKAAKQIKIDRPVDPTDPSLWP